MKHKQSNDHRCKAFKGNNGAYGVGGETWLLYEPSFTLRTAGEIARIENSGVHLSWEKLERVLAAKGFDVSDPSRGKVS